MRFEPKEFIDPLENPPKEIPLFRVAVSLNPVMLYLFFCAVFYCAFRLAGPLLRVDPLSFIIRFFLAGWACFLLLFALSFMVFLYNRIEVTDQRIHGYMFSIRHRHFSVALKDISSVRVSQLFFAGPLHYGRITLRIPQKRLYVFFVKEPFEIKKALDRAIEKERQRKIVT